MNLSVFKMVAVYVWQIHSIRNFAYTSYGWHGPPAGGRDLLPDDLQHGPGLRPPLQAQPRVHARLRVRVAAHAGLRG